MLSQQLRIRSYAALISAVLLVFSAAPAVAQPKPAPVIPPALRVLITPQQLRQAGLAFVGFPAGEAGFPNKCSGELTVSNALLASFQAKGFSLTTLCLALSSTWVETDPETGRQMRLAGVEFGTAERMHVMLDVPNCLKNGTPYLDCRFNFDFDGNYDGNGKNTEQRRQWWAARGHWIDGMMKKLISEGRYSRECGCADLELSKFYMYKDKKIARNPPQFGIKAGAFCYVETLPACAVSISKGTVLEGFLFLDADAALLGNLGYYDTSKELLNEPFDISKRHPHGYAHQMASPEGADDTPFVPLPAGTPITIGSKP